MLKRLFISTTVHLMLFCHHGRAQQQFGDVTPPLLTEYCHWETFEATCRRDEVVVIRDAFYGRMTHGRCIRRDSTDVGCYGNVRAVADGRCSGLHGCRIEVPDERFDRMIRCDDDLRYYLLIGYECLKVFLPTGNQCRISALDGESRHSEQGILASSVSAATGCGSPSTPWLIEVLPGQTINVTVVDFSFGAAGWNASSAAAAAADWRKVTSHCQVIAIITDKATKKAKTVCGGSHENSNAKRNKNYFLSENNTVEVRFHVPKMAAAGEGNQFIAYYQAVGCPDPDPTTYGWRRRSGQNATVRCSETSPDLWHVTCHGTKWIGHVGNCSSTTLNQVQSSPTFPLSQVAALYVMISIAAVVGIIIFIIGFRILRSRQQQGQGQLDDDHVDQRGGGGGDWDYFSVKLPRSLQYPSAAAADRKQHPQYDSENEYACVDELRQCGDYGTAATHRGYAYESTPLGPADWGESGPEGGGDSHEHDMVAPLATETRTGVHSGGDDAFGRHCQDVRQYLSIDRGSHFGRMPRHVEFRNRRALI